MNGMLPHVRFPAISLGGLAGRAFAATIVTVATGMIIENAEWPDWLRSMTVSAAPEERAQITLNNFVKFNTVELTNGDEIHTGLRFSDLQTMDRAESVWCYLKRPAPDGALEYMLTLARGDGGGVPEFFAIDDEAASTLGTTAAEIYRLTRAHCDFSIHTD